MTQLLRHALAEGNAVPDVALDIERLILVSVERTHIGGWQLLHGCHINGCGVQHHGDQLAGISVKGRRSRSSAVGLRHIKDLFDIVGNAGAAVLLGVLHGFKDGQALCALADLHAVLLPVPKLLELGRLRLLLVDEQGVGGGIAIHTRLCVQIAPELFRGIDDLGRRIVDHLIYGVLLRLFLGDVFLRRKLRSFRSAGLLGIEIVGHS